MKIYIIALILGDYDDYGNQYKSYNRLVMEQASSICEHCVRSFWESNQFDCERINLICTKKPRNEDRRFGTVLETDILFSPDYFNYDISERENYLYDVVKTGLDKVFGQRSWDTSLLSCLDEYRKNKFVSDFSVNLKCKQGSRLAHLHCRQSIQQAIFYVKIYEKTVLTHELEMFTCKPNAMDYDRFLGKLQWDDTNTLALYSKSGERVGKVYV